MNRRLRPIALTCAAVCALPVAAVAQSTGGTAYEEPGAAAPVGLQASDAILLGHRLHVRGTLAGAAGRTVVVQRREGDGAWEPAATAQADGSGAFDATWRTDHIGRFALRALVAGSDPPADDATARSATAAPANRVTVYRRTRATWFGPGFYGRRTACGQRLTRTLQGVAHPTLPCGTQVALLYHGRTVTVPVVDRGPFDHGASYDLTRATARALGFRTTALIGAVSLG